MLMLPTHGLEEGFVVVVDVVGFSRYSNDDQRLIIEHLCKSTTGSSLIKDLEPEHNRLLCTGDGFALVVVDPRVRANPCSLVDMLFELQRAAQGAEVQYEFRAGIHTGEFSYIDVFGKPNAIGTGINVATRVCNLGDAKHILISSSLEAKLCEREGASGHTASSYTRERCGAKLVKHGLPLEIFRVTSANGDGNPTQPRAFQRDKHIDKVVLAFLGSLRDSVERNVLHLDDKEDNEASRQALGSRLTVLLPDLGAEELVPSGYRVSRNHSLHRQSDARFCIAPGQENELSGYAYRDKAPKFAHRLPNKEDDVTGFVKTMNLTYGCRITEKQVASWGRANRAYLMVPIELQLDESRAVLAIDFLDPLNDVEPESMYDLAESLSGSLGRLPFLGLLLQAKR